MAHREFTDANGVDWIAYDVVPVTEERRSENRREADLHDAEALDRRGEDRRVTVGATRPVRLTQGWVCFEREGERRRLQPIPGNWHLLPEAGLARLVETARPAPRRKRAEENAAKAALNKNGA